MPALSYLIATLVFGGTWPMLGLIFWNVLIAANSPIPVICAVLVTLGFASLFLTILNYFSTIEMALELYHLPRYMMFHFTVLIPWLRHRLNVSVSHFGLKSIPFCILYDCVSIITANPQADLPL